MLCKSALTFEELKFELNFLLFTLKLNNFYKEFQLFYEMYYYNFKVTLCLLNTIVCYSDGFSVSKSFTRVCMSMGIV